MKFAGKRQRFYLIKAYRRSKTLRCRSRRCNCKWIDSLETPAWRGPKVQRTNRKQWECSDYEYIMAQAASRTNLSGNRTEKILDRYS